MFSSRPRSTASADPSPQFLFVEGVLLAGLLWLAAPAQMSQWGKWVYQQVTDHSQSIYSAPGLQVGDINSSISNRSSSAQALQGNALAVQTPTNLAIAPQPAAPERSTPNWTADTIDYFVDVALSREYGDGGSILKWQDALRIKVLGSPTEQDLQTLSTVTQELSQLTGLSIAVVDESPNVEIHFAPITEFAQLEPNYKPGNEGFFWTWFENGVIDRAKILINSEQTDEVRSHLLREELTQALGLMNDSRRDANSIFYQGWTETHAFNPTDQAVIQMLYQPSIRPNMTQAEALQVLKGS